MLSKHKIYLILSITVLLLISCSLVSLDSIMESLEPALESGTGDVDSPTPLEEDVLVFEDFEDDSSCFETYADENGAVKIFNDKLIIEATHPEGFAYADCGSEDYTDFILDVDVNYKGWTDEDQAYGFLIYFRDDLESSYEVRIDRDPSTGSYCIDFLNYADESANSVPLTYSDTYENPCWVDIPNEVGFGDTNHYRLVVVGDHFDLFINDIPVASVSDSKLSTGIIGIMVHSWGIDYGRIEVDNFKISKP